MNALIAEKPKLRLPNLNCGACGYKTCTDFALAVDEAKVEVKKCIHAKQVTKEENRQVNCLNCMGAENLAEKLGWKDSLKRDFDFILDIFEG
ncbi:MAG TPA: (Fe-S)-binding protein, partial [Bacteroidales bacterium]|nr:(Fe-S)-binding protein [Bacteroidales bacterium]